ncbi:MAG: hypothetical protein AB8B85_22615 [Paracoccaceae bacterium]
MATGAAALGLYGWRIEDPKASYAAFYDVSNWLTSWLVSGEGLWIYARNAINLMLVDQVDGFLLGMAVRALLSVLLWPFRICARWCSRSVRQKSSRKNT